ncbi:CDC42-like protein [Mya arenaria]|uniref:CDC42-like protein n=1 Tax=Mya arenaria TaxID=6604 RepID=A0ABY7FBY2_MYAAR|nr:cdc42 homolog [Mya arenaria]WAR19657.1 CDC42-like protein [Mya arenaria]
MVMKNDKTNVNVVPCTLVGDGMVGKTSMALAFVNREPPDQEYVATVFDDYAGSVSVHGEAYTVSIFDSAGQHDYESVRAFSYRDSEVIVVCYSVLEKDSLLNVKDVWVPEARQLTKRKKAIVLIGCQTDMREEGNTDHVTTSVGNDLAKDIGADAFLECSSTSMSSISEVFQTVVKTALKSRKRKSSLIRRLLRR